MGGTYVDCINIVGQKEHKIIDKQLKVLFLPFFCDVRLRKAKCVYEILDTAYRLYCLP